MKRGLCKALGFTLIELLVALAIVALLLAIATPSYFGGIGKAEEAVLKENLLQLRDALDKHYSDTGRYPESLDALVAKRYLRSIPIDPITRSSVTWITVADKGAKQDQVADVRSGAKGTGRDGKLYERW